MSIAASVSAARECLSFQLGDEDYLIDVLQVQEIRGYEAPTRLANAPRGVTGVLSLRGTVVPVVDLRLAFGLPQGFNALTVTIVLNVGGQTVGAVVDSVSDVVEFTPEQIRPAPKFHGMGAAMQVDGICSLQSGGRTRHLILLDIERLMIDLGLFELETA